MRIKSKTLIKYFGKRNITKEAFEKTGHNLFLDYSKGLIDTEEVFKILEEFKDDIEGFSISKADVDTVKDLLSKLPENKIKRLFIETTSTNFDLTFEDFSKCPNLEDINFQSVNHDAIVENFEIPESVKEARFGSILGIQNLKIGNLEEKPFISIYGVRKDDIESISDEVAEKIDSVQFDYSDRQLDIIDMGNFLGKFNNVQKVVHSPRLDENNVNNLVVITEMVKKSGYVFVSPKVLKEYQEFYETHYSDSGLNFSFSSGKIISEEKCQNINNAGTYFGTDLSKTDDFSKFKDIPSLKFVVDSMVDIPLEIAEKLQNEGIECSIEFNSYDNHDYQNSTYSLDEYVVMYKKMDELVGDIDINLPEEEKFKQIYTRVTTYLEYDDAIVEPRTRQEKKYSIDNARNCRNLKNALINGKTVCAGYADVFKNACLLKGIECEYFEGPIDTLMSRSSYRQHADENEEVIYSDDKDVITRGYHAWNKVKINEIWYNCDPTWDRRYILNQQVPKYALVSDEIYKSSGRPTSEKLRHPCHTTASSSVKEKIFSGFEPADNFYIKNKLLEFENTLDENGNPRQLPVLPKETLWSKVMSKIRMLAESSKQLINGTIYEIRTKINPDFDKTTEIPKIDDSELETGPIPIVNDSELETGPVETINDSELETGPVPVVDKDNESTVKPSWELTKEQLEEIKRKEKIRERKNLETKENQEKNNDYKLGER